MGANLPDRALWSGREREREREKGKFIEWTFGVKSKSIAVQSNLLNNSMVLSTKK